MEFPKPSVWIKELFGSLVEGLDCDRRQMFGCPCGFVNGQMFSGVFGDAIFVRLPEADRQRLLSQGGTPFDPMGGRPMKEYVELSDTMLEDEEMAGRWVAQALAYARSLPPKAAKKVGRPAMPARKVAGASRSKAGLRKAPAARR